MTLYKLDEWEHNGRDDSDWYAVVFDSETNSLKRVETGTTRFANALHAGPPMETPTPEIFTLAEKCLADIIFGMLKVKYDQECLEPNDVAEGDGVRLLRNLKNQVKECDEEFCIKCNGSGHWVNPKNQDDKRQCYSCKGFGKIRKNWRALKENGKPVWKHFGAGTSGIVKSCTTYGTFYNNGYNKPGRSNRQVILITDDGQEIKAPLEALRLDRDPPSDDKVRENAEALSKHRNFYFPFRTAGVRL